MKSATGTPPVSSTNALPAALISSLTLTGLVSTPLVAGLLGHRLDQLLLVALAVVVAVRQAVALPGVVEGLPALHVPAALLVPDRVLRLAGLAGVGQVHRLAVDDVPCGAT